MSSSRDFKRFLRISAAAVIAGVLASIGLVVIVDPYGLYRIVNQPGLNQIKPQLTRYRKEIKIAGADISGANIFIVGNSRAEIGFNPSHPALSGTGSAAYNLALAGMGLGAARDQLNQLAAKGVRPAKLIVGLDFLDFLMDPSKGLPAAKTPEPASRLAELQWQFDALFSLDSVIDSLTTLRIQRAKFAETMTQQGFNPFNEYRKFARDDGYYPLFQQRASEYAKRFVKSPTGLVSTASGSSPDFDHLRAIVAAAAAQDTEVHLAIYPYHAQILALFEPVGLIPAFEQWKVLLVKEMDSLRATYPGARITLWDFSGYSSFQCEAIPERGDKAAQTKWYWEAGHFKAELGDLILARMLTNKAAEENSEPIGTILTAANLAKNRARFDVERAACLHQQPALFRNAESMIAGKR